jgi:hypothetical protein
LIESEDKIEEVYNIDKSVVMAFNTYYNREELREMLDKDLDELKEEIEHQIDVYGEYEGFEVKEDYLETIKYLDENNMSIGETLSNGDIKIEINKVLDSGKVVISILEGFKKRKIAVNKEDIKSYLYQKQIQFESKILDFKNFLKNN